MASTALEEKINKIRLRNEEIKRRYEEVEADKKNAAKLDALVEPVPSEDWPERKEPPEFSAPFPKHANKSKHSMRKYNDQTAQYFTGSGEGKKAHNFADGQGPPPDPKYNFLADSEREEHGEETSRDTEKNRGRSKSTRGIFKRRGSGRDWHGKEQWNQQGSPGDVTRPDYEAWRAERNRIDEARISRQRTAEGNWRREWDNDKIHLADEVSKRENRVTLGDVVTRQEHSDGDKFYRSPRTAPRNSQHSIARESYHGSTILESNKGHGSVNDPEKSVVITTDRNIKVMLNPGSTPPKPSVMSVKVSPPNIAGTGRVGPRQRPRVMYSSQSDAEASTQESPSCTRQKSADEKIKGRSFDQTQKAATPKSPHPQRKRDGETKSPHPYRKDNDKIDKGEGTKSGKKDFQKTPYTQNRVNAPGNYPPKSPRVHRRSMDSVKNDIAKLPRAQQERNQEKCNTSSVSEECKREGTTEDVLILADASVAIRNDEPNELNKNNENVPINQSLSERTTNSLKLALESDKNFTSDNSPQNDSEPLKQSPLRSSPNPTEAVFQSVENSLASKKIKQSSPETLVDSAVLESDKNVISDNVTKKDSEPLEEIFLESSSSPADEVLQYAENNSASESIKESPLDTSVNMIEPGLESGENCVIDHGEKNKLLENLQLELSPSSAEGASCSAENDTMRESKEIQGEASGTREPNDMSSDDIDVGSRSNQAMINCSANSGLTSNDSGFLELPSSDSIHDVSDNDNAATSDFAEASMDSVQLDNEIVENRSIIEDLEVEPKVVDETVRDIAEPSSSDLEKITENSSTNILEESQKMMPLHDAAIDIGNVLLTQQASEESNIVKTTGTSDGTENKSEDTVNNGTELERLEKNSTTSSNARSNAHEGTENNAKLIKNNNVEVDSVKLELRKKDIVKSIIHEDAGNNSNTIKSEEKDLEITEKVAEATKDAQELQNRSNNESAIIFETSNNVCQQKADVALVEKLKDD